MGTLCAISTTLALVSHAWATPTASPVLAPTASPVVPFRVPVIVNATVRDSIDDVEQVAETGQVYTDSSDLEIVDDVTYAGMQSAVAVRFRDLWIEPGSIISSAYITFTVDEVDTDPCYLRIFAENVDDASAFSTTYYDLTNRRWTGASVSWTPSSWDVVGEKQATPDLSELVQVVVDRTGWTLGNSIAFFFNGTGERTAESYDGGGLDKAPVLVVEYLRETTFPPTPAVTDTPPPSTSPFPTVSPAPTVTKVPTPAPSVTFTPTSQDVLLQSQFDAVPAGTKDTIVLDESLTLSNAVRVTGGRAITLIGRITESRRRLLGMDEYRRAMQIESLAGASRLFEVSGVGTSLTLINLNLTGGGVSDDGGCFSITRGNLTLVNSTVHGCTSTSNGEARYTAAT